MEPDFDVIVVGAGVAGAVCAYQLARDGRNVLLVERAGQVGAKNLSGGVFYCRVMEEVFPGFAAVAPVERQITRNVLAFLNESSRVSVDVWDARHAEPAGGLGGANAVSVLRARLDPWLAEQCETAGVSVMPGILVDALVLEGAQVVGVRSGDDELRAHVVVLADGVNSFLAEQAGIRTKPPAAALALGVKSTIRLGAETIEDRFGLTGLEDGAAWAVVGEATRGVAGGGFIYTNKESVSIGVVLQLEDLAASGLDSIAIHDNFLAHPAIAPLLRGGELLEYGSHLTIEDGPGLAAQPSTAPGLVIIGDAAGLTLNTGLTIRGMDLAAGSALAAARAIGRALTAGDYSQAAMDGYKTELAATFVGADLKTYARAPAFFENKEIYRDLGPALADLFYGIYNHDLTPRRHLLAVARAALKDSRISLRRLGQIAWQAVRAL